MNHYLLWATGEDRPGFVAAVTKILFEQRCNLEDSSMMRLGKEFAMFVIFTSTKSLTEKKFTALTRRSDINFGLKKITSRQARFTPSQRDTYIVRVHGHDRPGIVYHVTECLSKHGFNITDLATHRTTLGKSPGYVLLLEGELPKKNFLKPLQKELGKISARLQTHVSLEPVSAQAL